MKHFFKYFVISVMAASACSDDEFRTPDLGLDYFPLRTGFYQVYNVQEKTYSKVNGNKELRYQIKTVVADSFPNAEGSYTYVILRSKRLDESAPWQNLDTWSVRENGKELVVAEGNTSFVKLMFPLKKGGSWNGNAYNAQTEDEFELSSVDEPFTVSDLTFDKSLTVIQEDNGDFIVFLDQRQEVYARGVGLVHKSTTQLEYCADDSCLGQQVVETGTIFKQEMVDYGIE